jgi:hypothetical protein
MAAIANTFKTYDAKGIREDLSDVIANISPEDTPFMSNLGKGPKPGNTFFEWQQDSLVAVDNTNAQLEGDDITAFDAVTPTVRVGNYCQISRKTLILSETEQEVDKAGRDDEEAYQIAKKGAELKRDIEAILIGTNQFGVTGAAATARKTAALLSWVRTNVDKDAGGCNPGAPAPFPGSGPYGQWRAPRVHRGAAQERDPAPVGAGWALRHRHGRRCPEADDVDVRRHRDEDDQSVGSKPATVIGAVDLYVSDFGTFSIVPNRFQRHRDALVLDFSLLKMRWLRPIKKVDLAKTGDADKAMLRGEYGLEVRQEAGLGLAADLS